MHVSGAPLVSFSSFQSVGCGAELSRIKATRPLEKGYTVKVRMFYNVLLPYYNLATSQENLSSGFPLR